MAKSFNAEDTKVYAKRAKGGRGEISLHSIIRFRRKIQLICEICENPREK